MIVMKRKVEGDIATVNLQQSLLLFGLAQYLVHGAAQRGVVAEGQVCFVCPNHDAAEVIIFGPVAFF